jgi:hypothetical protein
VEWNEVYHLGSGSGSDDTMRLFLTLTFGLVASWGLSAQTPDWKEASLVEIHTVNEWCRHCPDWNKTHYSFRLQDGMVYVVETHSQLNVTLNGHTRLRLDGDGKIGSTLHILDDSNSTKPEAQVEEYRNLIRRSDLGTNSCTHRTSSPSEALSRAVVVSLICITTFRICEAAA